jgi:hypothetical protein
VITFRYPDFASTTHSEPVYDNSEVLDFIQKIMKTAVTSTDRTTVGLEIRAVLKKEKVNQHH